MFGCGAAALLMVGGWMSDAAVAAAVSFVGDCFHPAYIKHTVLVLFLCKGPMCDIHSIDNVRQFDAVLVYV